MAVFHYVFCLTSCGWLWGISSISCFPIIKEVFSCLKSVFGRYLVMYLWLFILQNKCVTYCAVERRPYALWYMKQTHIRISKTQMTLRICFIAFPCYGCMFNYITAHVFLKHLKLRSDIIVITRNAYRRPTPKTFIRQ